MGVLTNAISGSGENTLKNLLDATKSCYYLFKDYQGTSVDDLIAYDDTENVIDMRYMFTTCNRLTSIPLLNTSNVKNMEAMFYSCSSLITIPLLNTSSVTDMGSMLGYCSKLSSLPLLNTSNVTNMERMFYGCSSLTSIPALDVSKVISFNNCFISCSSLKSILMTGMKANFDISASTKFEESDLVTILNNLATVTTTKTLKMGATNLAKLTDEDKAIATNKGWTLA